MVRGAGEFGGAGDAERVLRGLEARRAGRAPPPPGGLEDWRRCPKFHHAVTALQGWAAGAEGAAAGEGLAGRVQELERELLGLQAPAFCRPPAAGAGPGAGAGRGRGRGGDAAGRAGPVAAEVTAKADIPGVRWRPSGRGKTGAAAGGLRLSREARAELDQHGAAREALTDDLVGMAAGLRRNAEAMAARAGEGRGLMGRTEQLLEGNLARAGRANADARAALRRGWWRGLGLKLGMLFTVGLAFLGVYLFLKASSMAGYRHATARPRTAAPPPPAPSRMPPATPAPGAPAASAEPVPSGEL